MPFDASKIDMMSEFFSEDIDFDTFETDNQEEEVIIDIATAPVTQVETLIEGLSWFTKL